MQHCHNHNSNITHHTITIIAFCTIFIDTQVADIELYIMCTYMYLTEFLIVIQVPLT